MPVTASDHLVDLVEGGRLLGYSENYMRRMVVRTRPSWTKRPLPFVKDHRGRWVADINELEAWAAEHGIVVNKGS